MPPRGRGRPCGRRATSTRIRAPPRRVPPHTFPARRPSAVPPPTRDAGGGPSGAAERPSQSIHEQTAVDIDDLSGEVCRIWREQERDNARYVLRKAEPA